MEKRLLKVVLDTNILFSAIGFGGKPYQILLKVVGEEIEAITSHILLAELQEVLSKKLPLSEEDLQYTLENIKESFTIVQPRKTINIVKDEDDNRVLEAAVEGRCQYIVTGDKELLRLSSFKNIAILTAWQFLQTFELTKSKKN